MLHCIFVVTYMFVCNMLHIKKASSSALQHQQHPCIAAEISGIQMYNSAAFHYWLSPIRRVGCQPTCYRRGTKTDVFTDLGYCLLAVRVHLPDFSIPTFLPPLKRCPHAMHLYRCTFLRFPSFFTMGELHTGHFLFIMFFYSQIRKLTEYQFKCIANSTCF